MEEDCDKFSPCTVGQSILYIYFILYARALRVQVEGNIKFLRVFNAKVTLCRESAKSPLTNQTTLIDPDK